MDDEGPSSEDLERFSTGEAYCPDCGEAIFDDIEICPACSAFVGGRILRRPPVDERLQRRMNVVTIVLVLLVFLGFGYLFMRLFG